MRGRLLALLAVPQPAQFDAPPALPLTVSTPDLRLHLAGGQHAQRDGCHLICDAGTVIPVEEVLAAYLARPDDWRPDLPGPYSLVLLDPGRRRCLLARDHGGQRSLYYRAAAGQMTVASRLPDLLRAAGGRLPLHVPALLDSLVTGYPVPPETLYQGLRQVRAGHLLRWDAGAYSETPLPLPDAPQAPLRELLEQALPAATHAAAVLLSGGLDSAWLAALAAPRGTQAATARFAGVSQIDYAAEVAHSLGLAQRSVVCGAELPGLWLRLVDQTGVPQPDLGSAAVAAAVGEAAAGGATMVISGLGADELFGDWQPTARVPRHHTRGLPPSPLTATDAAQSYGVTPPRWPRWELLLRLRRELLDPEFQQSAAALLEAPPRPPLPPDELASDSAPVAAARFKLAGRIAGRLAPALEVAAGWHGIELCCPYLAEPVLAWGLQEAMALQAGPDKRLLRRAAREQLPESLLARPKRRRWRPDATWLLADPLPEPLAQVVSPQALGALGWFDPVTFHYWLGFVRARPREPLNQLRCRLLVTATALQWLAVRSQAS